MSNVMCIPRPQGGGECSRPARWHVWYLGFPGYTFMCDKHATRAMKRGCNGWHVGAVELMPDALLDSGDRAKGAPRD